METLISFTNKMQYVVQKAALELTYKTLCKHIIMYKINQYITVKKNR